MSNIMKGNDDARFCHGHRVLRRQLHQSEVKSFHRRRILDFLINNAKYHAEASRVQSLLLIITDKEADMILHHT